MTLPLQKLKSTWKWVSEPRNQSSVLFLTVVVLAFLFLRSCNQHESLKAELKIKENNLIALKDTVRVEKTKNGELQYVKTAFISDMKELKEMNKTLYDKVKEQETKVFYISQIAAEIKDKVNGFTPGGSHEYDPISGNDNIVWKFDTVGTGWSRSITGSTQFKVTSSCTGYTIEPRGSSLSEVNYRFNLTTGLKESKKYPGSLEIFINSSYPGMTFDDIQGSVVNPEDFKMFLATPEPKRWSVGPYIGLGYGITLQQTPQLVPVFNLGLGLQYKVISF